MLYKSFINLITLKNNNYLTHEMMLLRSPENK